MSKKFKAIKDEAVLERFKKELDPDIEAAHLQLMLHQILTNESKLLSFSSKGNIFMSEYNDKPLVVITDKKNTRIVSFLPTTHPYYKKESTRTIDDLPYFLGLLSDYKKICSNNATAETAGKPIFCEKCGSTKLYFDVEKVDIICHKCGNAANIEQRSLELQTRLTELKSSHIVPVKAMKLSEQLYRYVERSLDVVHNDELDVDITLSSNFKKTFLIFRNRTTLHADSNSYLVLWSDSTLTAERSIDKYIQTNKEKQNETTTTEQISHTQAD